MNIINIVNFVRGAEPRLEMDLLEPVKRQYALALEYGLPTTFLFQHDAFTQEAFARAVTPSEKIEVGLWLELSQGLVEKAGGVWNGRPGWSWDYFANAGMTIGYPAELRYRIIDTAMADFRTAFGFYPRTVAAWSIDAQSLKYLADHYDIDASLNCKDQWGTDGYSLWGGYYNQAYYPSVNHALCPGNTEAEQIPIPVFRMLSSDPVDQYCCGEGSNGQTVLTLEPACQEGGKQREWTQWFFRQSFQNPTLSFGYAQTGQENSFGWELMAEGYLMQMEMIAQMAEQNRVTVMTAGDTGKWYKNTFKRTPPSASVAYKGQKTAVWYYSRFYRAGLFEEKGIPFFRDLIIFDSRRKERYYDVCCTTSSMRYDNLPVIDSFRTSGSLGQDGGYFAGENGLIHSAGPIRAEETEAGTLRVTIPTEGEEIRMYFQEQGIEIETTASLVVRWTKNLNHPEVDEHRLRFTYEGYAYSVVIPQGSASVQGDCLRIAPEEQRIILKF